MTTQQNFYHDIIHFNAVAYKAIDNIIGNLNKEIGLSAHFIEWADKVLGSTVTENYDLLSLFGLYQEQMMSDNNQLLKQSLQNSSLGIGTTYSYPDFNVCTHITTGLFDYNFSISSSFLSGQIYSFSASGVGQTNVVSFDYDFVLSGNQFNSHLVDIPVDFAVFGLNNFNSVNYQNSSLVQFDYAWSSLNQSLLVKLNYSTVSTSQYYMVFYWGNTDSAFINTNSYINTLTSNIYVGTLGFINQIGVYTGSIVSSSLNDFSGRKNFWSNQVEYNINLNQESFNETSPYLWAPERINASLIDGVESTFSQPLRYPIINNSVFQTYLNQNSNKWSVVYSDFSTYGLYDQVANSQIGISSLYTSNFYQQYNTRYLADYYSNTVPGSITVFVQNPKKTNLKYSNGYSASFYEQIVPSAFVKVIEDSLLWSSFSKSLILAKTYSGSYTQLKQAYLGTLDNFLADFFFGANFNTVISYFTGVNLTISRNTIKQFSQPYGTHDTDPLNLSLYEERSLHEGTDIISSKPYINFNEGQLNFSYDYKLPDNWTFEIFKPISVVCNGIDPYDQGQGLAFDYTLNMQFEYQNQNTLNKKLYLMASKYLLSEADYQDRLDRNLNVDGYYYLADPESTDYNQYSVSSIDEFRLYGYAGLIPDLRDGVVRPILTKAFSPKDTTKYTYEEYVQLLISQGYTNQDDINEKIQEYLDEGNTFYVVNLDKFSNSFVSLKDIAIGITNYALNTPKYWNSNFYSNLSINAVSINNDITGFVDLTSTILSGGVYGTSPPPYTIQNVPVGYDCIIQTLSANSLGQNLIPGSYSQWVLPADSLVTVEQRGQIQYNILSSGILDPDSLEIINTGKGFSFEFDVYLNVPGFTTSLSTSYPSVHIGMDNIALFTATVNTSYSLVSFVQSTPPAYGYNQSFVLNNKCFNGIGYTSNADVIISIDNQPTVDSFLIAPSGLTPGVLENYANFNDPNNSFQQINYSLGTSEMVLFDNEIFNTFVMDASDRFTNISYVSVLCKIILSSSANPSGYIIANIYNELDGIKTKIASSNKIQNTDISRDFYTTINIPLDYTFNNNITNIDGQISDQITYWVSIEQHLENCYLSIKGDFQGISTSYFSISSSLTNSYNDLVLFGSISTNQVDLDISDITVSVSGIAGTGFMGINTNIISYFIRRDETYSTKDNKIYLGVNTVYNGIASLIYSNTIDIASLGTVFSECLFVMPTILNAGTEIDNTNFLFTRNTPRNSVYVARDLSLNDVTQSGLATSSQLSVNGSIYNFDFIFNKIFTQIDPNIYGSFNFSNSGQFGLPQANTLRTIPGINQVDGFWNFSSKKINNTVSVYPRSFYDNTSYIGTSDPTYQYAGYTHDIYLNLGYTSSNLSYQSELIRLSAHPTWKTTWMERTLSNYKDTRIFDVLQQGYRPSIDYYLGTASTNISNNYGPKTAIFEGYFAPEGNLSATVPITVGYGTSSGVQVYINDASSPLINTFGVISSAYTTVTGTLSTSVRENTVYFKVYYFTLSTASVEMYWDVGLGNTLINSQTSLNSETASPVAINSGHPVSQLMFMNISKTYSEAISVNNGFPPGDSFVIRSS